MKYSQAQYGRIFIIRLEDGDVIHESIEQFAQEHSIQAAALIILGGADEKSTLIVGPEQNRSTTITPLEHILDHVHEITGTGTLFPDETGKPMLHMHIACGKKNATVVGCVRRGVKTWHVAEIILFELLNTNAHRALDPATGFHLLNP